MKIKTSELTKHALDWAVAKCIHEPDDVVVFEGRVYAYPDSTNGFSPSTDWAQGGPIIERDNISIEYMAGAGDAGADVWVATRVEGSSISEEQGGTPLVAAMRAYVASQLGKEVEIPEELK